ncbi:hypothetical protein [uncultured Psychroserpens sp.]|uniref:hypothetical protein n=1 Tax=uncultured Psychroserpens sp. TaxID=255436 RepID=UPI00260D3966|nr:hypothetical protein [uncultured Psychroserpens sp.]
MGSLSQFKATLQRKADRNHKRSIYKKEQNLSYSKETPEYNFPELSDKELKQLKVDIRSKIQFENRKDFLIILAISLILAYLIYIFVLN